MTDDEYFQIKLDEMTNREKAMLVAKKIRYEFPYSPDGALLFGVIYQALFDASSPVSIGRVSAINGSYNDRESAREYLQGYMGHAEICGIDSSRIRIIIKKIGMDISL